MRALGAPRSISVPDAPWATRPAAGCSVGVAATQPVEDMLMDSTMKNRIDRMALIDRIWAIGFAVVLWIVYAFVFTQISPLVESGGVRLSMIVGGVLVLLFNTASIGAMLKQYADFKTATYEPDIRHLDEKREQNNR
jgi:hypothetical protein